LTHSSKVGGTQPTFGAIDSMAAHRDGYRNCQNLFHSKLLLLLTVAFLATFIIHVNLLCDLMNWCPLKVHHQPCYPSEG
jgi:hypothetical protein